MTKNRQPINLKSVTYFLLQFESYQFYPLHFLLSWNQVAGAPIDEEAHKYQQEIPNKVQVIKVFAKLLEFQFIDQINSIGAAVKASSMLKIHISSFLSLGSDTEQRLTRDLKGVKLQALLENFSGMTTAVKELETSLAAIPEDDVNGRWLKDVNIGVLTSNFSPDSVLDPYNLFTSQHKVKLQSAMEELHSVAGKWLEESWYGDCTDEDLNIVMPKFHETAQKIKAKNLNERLEQLSKAGQKHQNQVWPCGHL